MSHFNLVIATPQKKMYEGEVFSVLIPGKQGFFQVLFGHAPIVAMVDAGFVEIVDDQKITHRIEIQKGFFEFYQNKGILLA
jgi:F-type H+-transporting ATPase subunit epsilon